MTGESAGASLTGSIALATGAFLGAMLLLGLMTAFFRVSSLHRNGLLEERSLGRILRGYLRAPRLFMVTVSTLYLALTILGCVSWGALLRNLWTGVSDARYYALLVVLLVVAWSLGGMVCRRIAADAALGYARVLGTIVFPLHWLLRPWTAWMIWLMGRIDDTIWTGEAAPHLSSGEIRSLLDGDHSSVTLEDEEREMIHSIFSFHDTAVREIMVPRIDMVSLEATAAIAEVVPTVITAQHSRLPVHEGTVDRVVGILYAKDLLALFQDGQLVTEGKVVGELARPAYFIPESKKIDEVLTEFRAQRIHMAVVIDEYGGTAGLVTLEDVLEEIVGEIEDEFDVEEPLFDWVDERSLRVDPKIDLEDLEELVGIALPTEGSETLGGLIYEAAGKVPEEGERIQLAELTVTVEQVLDQRIRQVLLAAKEPLPGFSRFVAESEGKAGA